jgi:hypothetical protein
MSRSRIASKQRVRVPRATPKLVNSIESFVSIASRDLRDLEIIPADSNALFCSLADRLKDLAYRIAAGDERYRKIENDMVTIRRKPAAEAS